MFALIQNGAVAKYPVSIGDLRAVYPYTSFPKTISSALSAFGVVPVVPVNPPTYDPTTQTLDELYPTLVNGSYNQTWNVTTMPTPAAAALATQREDIARAQRDSLLRSTDYIVVVALEAGNTVAADWVTYRQALRDVPAQAGFPDNITWPTQPS